MDTIERAAPEHRITPADSIVPAGNEWLRTVWSFAELRYENAKQSWRNGWWGIPKAIFLLITLPVYIVIRSVWGTPQYAKFSHSGIVYFYILLSCTIVFNLWQQQEKGSDQSMSYLFVQYFEIICMGFSSVGMLYIYLFTINSVILEDYEKHLILYFRTGLYIFGIVSVGYNICNLINYGTCVDGLNILLYSVTPLYIASQILFLNRFYQAKFPSDTPLIQMVFAHILGTNLSLWFWTLCLEVYEPREKCKSYPIHLGNTEKYFYPLFVEYLLLAASMIYEVWNKMQVKGSPTRHTYFLHHYGAHESEYIEEPVADPNGQTVTERRLRNVKATPNRAISISFMFGLILAATSIGFVLASEHSGKNHSSQYTNFIIVNIMLYSVQNLVCYRVLFCRQSQLPNEERSSIDHDDALLYLGLAGIVLWEGFQLYALNFTAATRNIELANSTLGLLEGIIQTATLVAIRRYRSTKDNNANSISNCALFLLATNFAMWCQNSFFIQEFLENPGENHPKLETGLKVFAPILNPLIIFFRFHSATCCFHVWTIFHSDNSDTRQNDRKRINRTHIDHHSFN